MYIFSFFNFSAKIVHFFIEGMPALPYTPHQLRRLHWNHHDNNNDYKVEPIQAPIAKEGRWLLQYQLSTANSWELSLTGNVLTKESLVANAPHMGRPILKQHILHVKTSQLVHKVIKTRQLAHYVATSPFIPKKPHSLTHMPIICEQNIFHEKYLN